MALTGPDRKFIQGEFNTLHKRVTELRVKLERHLAAPCRNMKEHEDSYHKNGKKKLTLVVLFITALTGGLAFLVFIVQAIIKGVSI